MNRYHVWIYFSIIILFRSTDAACTFPAAIQSSNWNDETRSLLLTFSTSAMGGWPITSRGTLITDYNCLSNTDNVYVLKSVQTYTKSGITKWIYLCMRLTKVTDNLFYYYLMSDLDTTVIPNVRVFNPDTVPPDSDPTCDFCTFTTPPPDTEYNLLKRQGTSETLTTTPSLCLPCTTTQATCDFQPTTTITTTAGYFNNIRSVDLSLDGLMMFVSFNSDMTGVSNGGDTDNTSAPAQTGNPVTSVQPSIVVPTPTTTIAPIIQTQQVVTTDQTDNLSLTLLIVSALLGVIFTGILYRIL